MDVREYVSLVVFVDMTIGSGYVSLVVGLLSRERVVQLLNDGRGNDFHVVLVRGVGRALHVYEQSVVGHRVGGFLVVLQVRNSGYGSQLRERKLVSFYLYYLFYFFHFFFDFFLLLYFFLFLRFCLAWDYCFPHVYRRACAYSSGYGGRGSCRCIRVGVILLPRSFMAIRSARRYVFCLCWGFLCLLLRSFSRSLYVAMGGTLFLAGVTSVVVSNVFNVRCPCSCVCCEPCVLGV